MIFFYPLKIVIGTCLKCLSLPSGLYFFLKLQKVSILEYTAGWSSFREKVHVGVKVSNTVYKIDNFRKYFFLGPCKAKNEIHILALHRRIIKTYAQFFVRWGYLNKILRKFCFPQLCRSYLIDSTGMS
jgi:hypothetical protein